MPNRKIIFYSTFLSPPTSAIVQTQMPNRKIIFYSTFLSPLTSLFNFFLSLLRICLSFSPKFPTRVLPLLTIGREQEEGGGGSQERRKGSRDVVKIDGDVGFVERSGFDF